MEKRFLAIPKQRQGKIQLIQPEATCKLNRDSFKFYLIDKFKPKKDVGKLFSKLIEGNFDLHLLGQIYYNSSLSLVSSGCTILQIEKVFKSMKKFTYNDQIRYRKGFISDVGWGCTIRSGQMLLFNMLLFKIIQQRINIKYSKNLEDKSINLLILFHDNRTTNFSFSNFIEKSNKSVNKKLNEYWNAKEFFIACESILEESNHHVSFLNLDIKLKLFISDDGGVNVTGIKEALIKSQTTLLVFNINIGNEDNRRRFKKEFLELIELKFFSGMIGGHKREAYYVFGNYSDRLLYLDPHKIRDGKTERNFDVSTYYEISYEKINASTTLTFTIQNMDEFLEFLDEIRSMNTELLYEQSQDISDNISECEIFDTSFNQDMSFEKVADTNDFHNINGTLYTANEIDKRLLGNNGPHLTNYTEFYKIPFDDANKKNGRKDSGAFVKNKGNTNKKYKFERKESFIDLNPNIEDLRRELSDDFFIKQNYLNF